MAKKIDSNIVQLRDYAVKPRIENFAHQVITVPEWDNSTIICRAMSAGDWYDYQQLAKKIALREHPDFESEESEVQDKLIGEVNPFELYSLVFVRCIYDPVNKERIFTDDDRPDITACFSPVHDRLTAAVFALSQVQAGDEPKNA